MKSKRLKKEHKYNFITKCHIQIVSEQHKLRYVLNITTLRNNMVG